MTAGKIKRDWYDAALQNGSHKEIEGWFSEMVNYECTIYDNPLDSTTDLEVFVSRGSHSHWLDQDRIDDICRRINEQ